MDRQVFISYAADDADWTAERVAEFAQWLDTLNVCVHLDVRHQQSVGEKLATSEWWDWMDASMASATHVVCLCSDRYAEAWERKESVSGGCGVALEATKIVAYLYDEKQNNKGRVLTVVGKSGHRGMIPNALKTVCPYYRFGHPEDDQLLWSHLSGRGGAQGSATERPAEGKQKPLQSLPGIDRKQSSQKQTKPISAARKRSPSRSPILLLTVNQRETDALRDVFGAVQAPKSITRGDYPYWQFASVQDEAGQPERDVFGFSCQMGSVRSGAALQRVTKASEHFKPDAIFAVGVSFGLKDGQNLGDVLISSQVTTYDSARLNKDGSSIPRAEILPATPKWLARAKHIELMGIRRREGLIICGEKLVDDPEFREFLRNHYPLAVGGDMESFGVATACNGHDRLNIGWLIIKGISDLGDGNKNAAGELQSDLDQYRAAYKAAIVAYSAVYLRRPDVASVDDASWAWLQRQTGSSDISLPPKVVPQTEAQDEEGFIPLDRKTLKHQADHAIKSLEGANAYWVALQAADALLPYVGAENLQSPRTFIEYLYGLKPDQSFDVIAKVMGELRRTFTANRRTFSDVDAESAANSLVACFLYCACLMISPEGIGSAATVKLPSMENSDAAGLMASLIALVMVGGRLDLQQGGRELPVGTGTYRLQKAGRNSEHDFERQLFTLIVKNPWTVSAGLKTGPLSDDERAELLEELRDLRGDGIHTQVICFIIDSEDHPGPDALGVARTIAVPVFHAHADIEARLFGIDGATLLTRLKHLWRDVSSHRRYGREDDAP